MRRHSRGLRIEKEESAGEEIYCRGRAVWGNQVKVEVELSGMETKDREADGKVESQEPGL